jgi:FG-GAP-like repeat
VTHRALFLSLLTLFSLSLAACETGGGGGSGDGASVEAVQVIDLPAGLTEATLGWSPSEGRVTGYAIYESRNGAEYEVTQTVTSPMATIAGSDGDAVRIAVAAIGRSGNYSKPSPPSPEMRFHAMEPTEAAAAATATSMQRGSLVASTASVPTQTSLDSSVVDTSSAASETALAADATATGMDQPDSVDDAEVADAEESTRELRDSFLTLLVTSNARFPVAGLSESAQSWMQARVEEQFNAGVRLVGTGDVDHDALRELVWQDPAGQLFISTGRSIIDAVSSTDIPSSFEEGVRLRATERFIALGDFTGDTASDWLVEDMSTGDVFLVDGASLEITNAHAALDSAEALLVGHGDFDGDGKEELLWEEPDGQLRFGHPKRALSNLNGAAPVDASSLLAAMADIDGDGSDDIVSVDAEGRLEWTLVRADASGALFEPQIGPDLVTDALELLVALDVDDDGRAEIAWLNAEGLEVWSTDSGPRDF